jgi:hypothetical protein
MRVWAICKMAQAAFLTSSDPFQTASKINIQSVRYFFVRFNSYSPNLNTHCLIVLKLGEQFAWCIDSISNVLEIPLRLFNPDIKNLIARKIVYTM